MWCWWMVITCSSRTWHGTSTRITFVICVAHHLIGVCAIVAPDCAKPASTRRAPSVNTPRGRTFQCPVWQRYFFGTQCHRRHLDRHGQCPNLWRYCEKCHHEYQHDARHAHKCGERYCKVCNAIRPQEHRCFVPVHRLGGCQNHRARRSCDQRVVLHPIVKPWICWTGVGTGCYWTIVSIWSFLTLKPSKKRVNISRPW